MQSPEQKTSCGAETKLKEAVVVYDILKKSGVVFSRAVNAI